MNVIERRGSGTARRWRPAGHGSAVAPVPGAAWLSCLFALDLFDAVCAIAVEGDDLPLLLYLQIDLGFALLRVDNDRACYHGDWVSTLKGAKNNLVGLEDRTIAREVELVCPATQLGGRATVPKEQATRIVNKVKTVMQATIMPVCVAVPKVEFCARPHSCWNEQCESD